MRRRCIVIMFAIFVLGWENAFEDPLYQTVE
jgi:hypothetical protein